MTRDCPDHTCFWILLLLGFQNYHSLLGYHPFRLCPRLLTLSAKITSKTHFNPPNILKSRKFYPPAYLRAPSDRYENVENSKILSYNRFKEGYLLFRKLKKKIFKNSGSSSQIGRRVNCNGVRNSIYYYNKLDRFVKGIY